MGYHSTNFPLTSLLTAIYTIRAEVEFHLYIEVFCPFNEKNLK